ncbi:MAG: hypothetical protein HY958_11450 [Bacteroidia bacterium]|nr:hypothetical protein [Bacteroidia bacterium]
MKKFMLFFSVCFMLTGLTMTALSQNTNKYSGRLSYDGKEYEYETTCPGKKEMMTTTIETYGLIIYKVKKDKKKEILKTHCMALSVKKGDSDVKKNLDHIKFTTVNDKGLAPEVEGTSKKMTMEFNLDNFTLIPQFGNNSSVGCSDFNDGIKNVVIFILKEMD